MKPRFTRRALVQVEEIKAHIEKDNPRAAAAVVRRISVVAKLVALHPSIGRSTAMKDIRVFGASPYPYLVFYRPTETGAVILRVRHTARGLDWRAGR